MFSKIKLVSLIVAVFALGVVVGRFSHTHTPVVQASSPAQVQYEVIDHIVYEHVEVQRVVEVAVPVVEYIYIQAQCEPCNVVCDDSSVITTTVDIITPTVDIVVPVPTVVEPTPIVVEPTPVEPTPVVVVPEPVLPTPTPEIPEIVVIVPEPQEQDRCNNGVGWGSDGNKSDPDGSEGCDSTGFERKDWTARDEFDVDDNPITQPGEKTVHQMSDGKVAGPDKAASAEAPAAATEPKTHKTPKEVKNNGSSK